MHSLPDRGPLASFNPHHLRDRRQLSETVENPRFMALHVNLYEIGNERELVTDGSKGADANSKHVPRATRRSNTVYRQFRLIGKRTPALRIRKRNANAKHVRPMIAPHIFPEQRQGPRVRFNAHNAAQRVFRSDQRVGTNVGSHVHKYAAEPAKQCTEQAHIVEIIGTHRVDKGSHSIRMIDKQSRRLPNRQLAGKLMKHLFHLPSKMPAESANRPNAIRLNDLAERIEELVGHSKFTVWQPASALVCNCRF